jgi:RNA polymerase sigma-70 factor (ECF subfamily)
MHHGKATCTARGPDIELLMTQYQQADSEAAAALVALLSPQLYRFLAGKMGSRTDVEDMLRDLWRRIHRVRHTYRASEPLLPWVYAIARRVQVDNYRKPQCNASQESAVEVLSEAPTQKNQVKTGLPAFEDLVASLPERQREVVTMLKVNELSLEEGLALLVPP